MSSNETMIPIVANENIVNISNFTNTTISSGFSDGNLLVVNSSDTETSKTVNINFVDKDNTEKTSITTSSGKSLKFIWGNEVGKWINIS